MRNWAPLWSMIVDSSLWSEPDYVCKIFITMLALKDSDDVCRCNAYQLSMRAKKPENEVLDALRILSSPDKRRMEPQEHQGRRIKAVEDGFLILNGAKYREMMSREMEKARWRRAKARQRLKNNNKPLSGQIANEQMARNGATEQELTRHAQSFLPDQGSGGSSQHGKTSH